ncbi:MAG: hypothetical protein Tsb0013_01600 [Phycisphaerales bacterium]
MQTKSKVGWALAGSVLMLAGPLAMTGCENGSRSSRDDRFQTTAVDLENDPYYQSGLRLVWRAYPQVGERARPLYCDVLGGDLAFQDTSNTLSLIEGTTGRVRWTAALGQPLERFLGAAREGETVITASESELQFLDIQNGQLLDRQRLDPLANTRPVVIWPLAVMGSATGEVFAHDMRVGVRVWSVDLRGPINAPVVSLGGDDIGAVSEGGEVIMLDAGSGTSGGRRATLFDGMATAPVTDGAQLYVAGLDQSVWAYRIENGRRSWRHRTQSELTAQPVIGGGVLVLHAAREGLIGLNAQTGERLWSQPDARGDGVVASDTSATLWDGQTLTVVSLRDGSIRSQVELPGIKWVYPGQEGVVFAVAENGVVSKYEPL